MTIGLMLNGAVILIGVFVLMFVIGGYNALVTVTEEVTSTIANTFNFDPAELFVIEKPEQRETPKVAF